MNYSSTIQTILHLVVVVIVTALFRPTPSLANPLAPSEPRITITRVELAQLHKAKVGFDSADLLRLYDLEARLSNVDKISVNRNDLPKITQSNVSLFEAWLSSDDTNLNRLAAFMAWPDLWDHELLAVAILRMAESKNSSDQALLAEYLERYEYSTPPHTIQEWILQRLQENLSGKQTRQYKNIIENGNTVESLAYAIRNGLRLHSFIREYPYLFESLSKELQELTAIKVLTEASNDSQLENFYQIVFDRNPELLQVEADSPIQLRTIENSVTFTIVLSDDKLRQFYAQQLLTILKKQPHMVRNQDTFPRIIEIVGPTRFQEAVVTALKNPEIYPPELLLLYLAASGYLSKDILDVIKEESLLTKLSSSTVHDANFPEDLRAQWIDLAIRNKEFNDLIPVLHNDFFNSVRLTPEGLSNLSEYKDRLIPLLKEEIEVQLLMSEHDYFQLSTLLRQLGALGVQDPELVKQALDHTPTERQDERNGYLQSIASIMPENDLLIRNLVNATLPDIPGFINSEDSIKALEHIRSALPAQTQAAFDKAVYELTFSPSKKRDPCDVICLVRNDPRWVHSRYVKAGQVDGPPSEYEFGIKNLIAFFELKTRNLCPENPVSKRFLDQFHVSVPPVAVKYLTTQAEEHEMRQRTEFITALGRVVRYTLQRASTWGAIDSETYHQASGFLNQVITATSGADQSNTSNSSRPGQPTNSLVYAIMMGLLAYEQVPPEEKSQWAEWHQMLLTSANFLIDGFEQKVSGLGGSHFGSFAIALTALSHPEPPQALIKDMKKMAADISYTCEIPYSRERSLPATFDEAIFRSTVFYYALYRHTQHPIYRTALVNCLEEYATDHSGAIHSQSNRTRTWHIGPRNVAPYYFYATLMFATQAASELKAEASATDDTGEPNSERQRFDDILETLTQRALDQFDEDEGLFTLKSEGLATDLPAVFNPLMAMALIPACVESKSNEPVRN